MVRTHSVIKPPPWPREVGLPSGQSWMDPLDWIDYVEPFVVEIDRLDGLDRVLLDAVRCRPMAVCRFHYRAAGLHCPRWPKQRMSPV